MRTTLNLDDEVLAVVRELARSHHTSLGEEVSRLVRQALQGSGKGKEKGVAGFEPFPAQDRVVTDGLIEELREREGV